MRRISRSDQWQAGDGKLICRLHGCQFAIISFFCWWLVACGGAEGTPAGTATPPIPPLASLPAPTGAKSAAISTSSIPFLMELDRFQSSGAVGTLAIDPAGNLLAAGGANGQLELWGTHGEGQLARLSEQGPAVYGLAFRPDGRLLVAQQGEGQVTVWDVPGRSRLRQFFLSSEMGQVNFVPAGLRLTPLSNPLSATLYNLDNGQPLGPISPTLPFPSLILPALSLDGKRAVTYAQELTIWDVASGQKVVALAPAGANITTVALNLDGSVLVTGDETGLLSLWDVGSGRVMSQLSGHEEAITGLGFRPDGYLLFSAGHDATIRVWGMPIP